MKKIAILASLLVSLGLYGTAAFAEITGTSHDLTSNTTLLTNAGNTEICAYCHTPHDASTTNTTTPLWNHEDTQATYTMYSSPSLDMTIAGSPAGVSLACLSCHDGTVAADQLLNFPSGVNAGQGIFSLGNSLGTDLSNDHPISLTYNAAQDVDFVAPVNSQVNGLQLFGAGGDQVECGTCHSVHDNTNEPFLRMSNAGSALCLACHVK
ncbi:MAG: cytochrome c3 family protein [gamma proteobacterium symbiont of Clathrolucina costata]|uniref:Cytochrome c3 family protein n=1 Tax=Candidatus Thiodiazotropha taylori TaxID=2792791 RepID=A0A9E4NMG4_9GAMM|nr:cytochrome c3 family protein [Candidatus Thiodiazotropha taylori]MCG7979477.1 cytochrome c3 family protein [Candidatus Thiodiazotropha taylori]MCW4237608.1 cytochrome c3 family protein [Candidatus Thiodiazotropha endolucinida]